MAPTFFVGSGTAASASAPFAPGNGCVTTTPQLCKVVQYPAEITTVPGSISGNTICIDVPNFLTTGFGAGRPINGSVLYNVTAFSGGRNNATTDVYADVDATRSFDFQVGTVSTVPLLNVVSRKVHGSAGTFDIDLPLNGPPGIECRSSAADGPGNYTLIFTFANRITACGTPTTSAGSVSGSPPSGNSCTVNLTGVPNAQFVTVTLTGVSDIACNIGDVSSTMGVLLGDVDASGRVDSTDVFQVRQQTLQNANSSNFRMDVDESGRIDATDVFITRQQTLTSLP
jgi:hypothetical protein